MDDNERQRIRKEIEDRNASTPRAIQWRKDQETRKQMDALRSPSEYAMIGIFLMLGFAFVGTLALMCWLTG